MDFIKIVNEAFATGKEHPSFRSGVKLKDSDLNAISNFTMEVGVGLVIGLGVISSLSSKWADTIGYIYALLSTLAFCVIWRYVKSHEN